MYINLLEQVKGEFARLEKVSGLLIYYVEHCDPDVI